MPPVAPLAFNPPKFDLAYIISDLHIGGESGHQMFAAATQFRTFIEMILEEAKNLPKKDPPACVLLVINGDFVDFLAESGAAAFNFDRSSVMLEDIFTRRDEFLDVLKALQDFVAADGTRLVITLGNHDLELALPNTRQKLLELLAPDNPVLQGKVELCFDGWGYRFRVGEYRALCLHGNEADEYNFTRYDDLDRIVHDLYLFDDSTFGRSWRPSAGSEFVINALNPVKRQFPFVDMLKPERTLMPRVLGILDPTKVKYVEELFIMGWNAKSNEKARPGSQRRMLSTATTERDRAGDGAVSQLSGRGLTADEIIERAEIALQNGKIDELIRLPVDGQMLGWREWTAPLRDAVNWMKDQALDVANLIDKELTEAAETIHSSALQKAIRGIVNDDPYDPGVLDDYDTAINAGVRQELYDVVLAGHTHFRRMAKRPEGKGIYVNTGTWAGLMGLTRAQVDSPEFIDIYRALRSGERAKLYELGLVRSECTYARIFQADENTVSVSLHWWEVPPGEKEPKLMEETRPLGNS